MHTTIKFNVFDHRILHGERTNVPKRHGKIKFGMRVWEHQNWHTGTILLKNDVVFRCRHKRFKFRT